VTRHLESSGTWTDRYAPALKEHWRQFLRDAIVLIKIATVNQKPDGGMA